MTDKEKNQNPLQSDANDQVRERFRKLEALAARGVDPFGGRFPKEGPIRSTVEAYEENRAVSTAGRLSAMRTMGKSTFCDLKDSSGRIQLYVKRENLDEASAAVFDLLDLGDI